MATHLEPELDSPLIPATIQKVPDTEPLERLCEALLHLIRQGKSQGPSRMLAELAQVIGSGCASALDLLRTELKDVEDTELRLQSLARSSLFSLGHDGETVVQRLEAHRRQLRSVIDELRNVQLASAVHPAAEVRLPPRHSPEALRLTDEALHGTVEPISLLSDGDVVGAKPESAAGLTTELQTVQTDPKIDCLAADDLKHQNAAGPDWLQQGRQLLIQGEISLAIEAFSKSLNVNNRDPVIYCWRGDAYSVNHSFESAIADYTRSLELQADYFPAKYNRAVAYRMDGNLQQATNEFDEIIRSRPDFGPAYLNRGIIYELQGDPKKAAINYRTAVRYMPKSKEAMERLQALRVLLDEDKPRALPDATIEPAKPELPAEPAKLEVATINPSIKDVPPPRELRDNLVVDCPACGFETSVQWKKLQPGKVLTCPHCRKTFTSKSTGDLSEVVKDASGRWLFRATIDERQRSVRERRMQFAGIAGVLVLLALVWWVPKPSQARSQAEAKLPTELEERAEVFARAWLTSDSRILRRLTDPVHDRMLFTWCRRNPPPHISLDKEELGRKLKIAVTRLPGQAAPTWVHVRIEGLEANPADAYEMRLAWDARADHWFFQPG